MTGLPTGVCSIFLAAVELLHVAERADSTSVQVRDHGMLEAVAARPGASVAGRDVHLGLVDEAAALKHFPARNHALVDGNIR